MKNPNKTKIYVRTNKLLYNRYEEVLRLRQRILDVKSAKQVRAESSRLKVE